MLKGPSAFVSACASGIGLSMAVSRDVAETRTTCNAVCPGYVKTPLVEGGLPAPCA